MHRQRRDRQIRIADKGKTNGERHASAQLVVCVRHPALHQKRAAGTIDYTVDGADFAREREVAHAKRRDGDLLAQGQLAHHPLWHAKIDQDLAAIGDGGQLILRIDPIAFFNVGDPHPARDRCEDAALRQVKLRLAKREFGALQGELRLTQAHFADRTGVLQSLYTYLFRAGIL